MSVDTAPRPTPILPAWLAWGVGLAGVAAMVVGLGYDYGVPDSTPGLGWNQLVLAVGGYFMLELARALLDGDIRSHAEEVAKVAAVMVQLLLLSRLITLLEIENPAFYDRLIPFMVVGFLAHHAVTPRWRLAFFTALSIGACVLVMGAPDAAWLVGLGLVLVGICHLPIGWWARVGILLAAWGGLSLLRVGIVPTPWSRVVWPILGSMFMFRIIVYMHHLKNAKEKPEGWRALAYFFLLPNVMFPLFPVIDYKEFRRRHFDGNPFDIYQRGILWILLGIVHLIAYRVVYHHFVMPVSEVESVLDLGRQVGSTFLLYFQVSGQFHIIIGMLHLFGFKMPEANNWFLLSSSMNDFWRRTNIYWKDFMMKTFYYPVFFKTRKYGLAKGLILAIAVVFVLNWALHAYQWFWILGAAPFSWTDTAFFVLLAVALMANGVWELRRGRQRTLGKPEKTFRLSMVRAMSTVGFMLALTFFWTMWNAPSFGEWFLLLDVDYRLADVLTLLGIIAGATIGLAVALHMGLARRLDTGERVPVTGFWKTSGAGLAAVLVLLTLGSPRTFEGANVAVQDVVTGLRTAGLNQTDAEQLRRGYYEDLTGVNRLNGELWRIYARSADTWDFDGMTVSTGDMLETRLKAGYGGWGKDAWITINEHGLRDQSYDLVPTGDVFRVALLGGSYVMGTGVEDDETFEAVAEARLAEDADMGPSVEVINFAAPGYSAIQQVFMLRQVVVDWSPDVIVLAQNAGDVRFNSRYLGRMLEEGLDIGDPELLQLIEQAGVTPGESEERAITRLESVEFDLVSWAYRSLVAEAEARGLTTVWVHVPTPEEEDLARLETMRGLAADAGMRIHDVGDVYAGRDLIELSLAEYDRHPNAEGHRLLAGGFVRILRELSATLD